jgi:hypothetical protein
MALKIVSGLSVTSIQLSSFLDLAKGELRNAQIQNLSTTQINAITSPAQGQFVYDSTLDKLKVYDGSAWTLVGAAADESTITLSSNTLTIKDSGVATAKLASLAVTTAKIAAGAVTNAKLGADAVTGAKIADNAINSEHYTDGSIDTAHIADAQVTGAKMAALTVATGNIANLAVTSGKLAASAVGTAKLADDAVTTAKIADAQITADLIATDAVTAAKIADNSVDIARLNVSDGSAGQFLKTDGNGTMSFATAIDDSVSSTNLTATLANLDTTHAVNVHGSGSTNIIIGSGTNTPNVQVTGDVIVDGDLMVSGTTTTVNSTTVTIDDPVFTLGGDTAPSGDDNKDRGIEFRYHDGTSAKLGFFGYDDSAREFTAYVDATNNDEVFSGTLAAAKFGTVEAGIITTSISLGGTTITSTAAELNILDGVTASTAELNKTDGLTASTAELNIMDGVTATTTELNYVDGVTSAIQTQINSKQPTITGAATTIDDTNLTASRVVVSNASGKIAASAVTSSELGVLDGITASTAELNKMDGVTVSTATINDIVNRAKRYVHTETNHSGGELIIAGSTHNLTAPFHISVIDSGGAMLLAEIVQNQSTGAITIQDLPAETIKVHITGGE